VNAKKRKTSFFSIENNTGCEKENYDIKYQGPQSAYPPFDGPVAAGGGIDIGICWAADDCCWGWFPVRLSMYLLAFSLVME
jgi:hypothetical protein